MKKLLLFGFLSGFAGCKEPNKHLQAKAPIWPGFHRGYYQNISDSVGYVNYVWVEAGESAEYKLRIEKQRRRKEREVPDKLDSIIKLLNEIKNKGR